MTLPDDVTVERIPDAMFGVYRVLWDGERVGTVRRGLSGWDGRDNRCARVANRRTRNEAAFEVARAAYERTQRVGNG